MRCCCCCCCCDADPPLKSANSLATPGAGLRRRRAARSCRLWDVVEAGWAGGCAAQSLQSDASQRFRRPRCTSATGKHRKRRAYVLSRLRPGHSLTAGRPDLRPGDRHPRIHWATRTYAKTAQWSRYARWRSHSTNEGEVALALDQRGGGGARTRPTKGVPTISLAHLHRATQKPRTSRSGASVTRVQL